jgi:hypothetical protein
MKTITRSTRGIMHFSRIAFGLAVAAGLVIGPVVKLSSEQAPPVSVPGIDKPVVVVTGEVTGTEAWVNSNYYVLRGAVFVRNGATLNIQAGTRIIGESGSVGTLIVDRGGRLNALGTATSAAGKRPVRATRASTAGPTTTTTAAVSTTFVWSSRA